MQAVCLSLRGYGELYVSYMWPDRGLRRAADADPDLSRPAPVTIDGGPTISFVDRSALTGKRALKQFLVSSSISGLRALQEESVASATGKYCLPTEAKLCMWSGKKIHPDDLRTCELTRIDGHFEFMTTNGACRLEPLVDLLDGVRRKADKPELWTKIAEDMSSIASAKSQVVELVSVKRAVCSAIT